MDTSTLLRRTYSDLGDIRNKLHFFDLCRKNGVIPSGLALSFNLALGVNEPSLVNKIEKTLDEASSEIMDTLIDFCSRKEEELEKEFDNRKDEVEDVREVTIMKREVNARKAEGRINMQQKLTSLKQKIVLPEEFKRSKGSRKIKARFYKPSQTLRPPSPHVRGLRKHRRGRSGRPQQLVRRRMRRREVRRRRHLALEEEERVIVEEEVIKRNPINESSIQLTPTQVEVTRLAAKFVPMDRRPVDMGNVNGGFERFANILRWAWFHYRRREEGRSEEEVHFLVPHIFCLNLKIK